MLMRLISCDEIKTDGGGEGRKTRPPYLFSKYGISQKRGREDYVFAVFTLAVSSLRSSVQSSHIEAKALSPSTSSASRRSFLRNGGERIHARILSLSISQRPVLCLSIQKRCRFQPSKGEISPYGETCRNYAHQGEIVSQRYGLYTVV